MDSFDKWLEDVGNDTNAQPVSNNPWDITEEEIVKDFAEQIRDQIDQDILDSIDGMWWSPKLPKFVLHPSSVRESDGNLHYISDQELAKLYKVNIEQCVTVVAGKPESCCGLNLLDPRYIHLFPCGDGNYQLP